MPSAAALRTPPLPSTNANRGRAGTFVTFVIVVMMSLWLSFAYVGSDAGSGTIRTRLKGTWPVRPG